MQIACQKVFFFHRTDVDVGECGKPEHIDTERKLTLRIKELATLIGRGNVVAHTGAGISTASGISDFRVSAI